MPRDKIFQRLKKLKILRKNQNIPRENANLLNNFDFNIIQFFIKKAIGFANFYK